MSSSGVQISLIISTSNRAQHLRAVLYALNRQTYQNFEVVVVVGPTQDETFAVLEEFAGRVRVVECPVFNLSVSRNLGVEAAAGEVVAFLDDDALPGITWLEQLAQIFAGKDVAGTGGKVYRIWPDGRGDIQFLFGMSSILAEDRDVRLSPDTPIYSDTPPNWWFPRLTGGNMAYHRASLIEVGGFDERFAYMFEEAELAIRIGLKNYRLLPLPEAIVYHFPASGPNRQRKSLNVNWYAWTRGAIYFALKHGPPIAGWKITLTKIVGHIHYILRALADYNHTNKLSKSDYLNILGQLTQGIGWGFWFGLFRPPGTIQNKINHTERFFNPYLIDHSNRTPFLPPPGIPFPSCLSVMVEEPLRVAYLLLTNTVDSDDDRQQDIYLIQELMSLGHEIHLIKLSTHNRVTFANGAFIHEIVPEINRYRHYRQSGYASLFKYLNHSHSAYEKLRSLIINHKIQVVNSSLGQLAGLVAAVTGVAPVILNSSHFFEEQSKFYQENQLIKALEIKLLRLSSGVILHQPNALDAIAQIYKVTLENKPTLTINSETTNRQKEAQAIASFYRTIIHRYKSNATCPI